MEESNPKKNDVFAIMDRAFNGAGVAIFLLVVVFTFVEKPDTGNLRWMKLPLIFVPIAGAAGGIAFGLTSVLRKKGDWHAIAGNMISIIIYCILVCLAFVLSINGTGLFF